MKITYKFQDLAAKLSIGLLLTLTACASVQQIPEDKVSHFLAGAASEVVGSKLDLSPTSSAFAIGFAKELYDYADYGRFDVKDLMATWLGGVVVNYIKNKKWKNYQKNHK